MIIGGGFGGLYAARAFKDQPVRVTVVDRRNHHLFQPLLYQVATASLSPADIAQPIRSILRKQANARVLLAEVTRVSLAARVVEFRDGHLDYDYLILAAGAQTSYFGHEEWRPLAPGLKSIEDALEIRRQVFLAFEAAERATDDRTRRELLTFVVVGGGPTGVELAGALAEIARQTLAREFDHIDPRTTRIYMLDAADRILPMFDASLARRAAKDLRELGVEIITGAPVTKIERGAVELGGDSPRRIEARTILWGAGVMAAPVGKSLGVETDRGGRIVVNPDLTVPGHPEVFVVGDLANLKGPDGKPLPGLAPVAMQEGRHAAHNVLRAVSGQPLLAFRYNDRGSMATIGWNRAIAEIRGVKLKGFPAWVAWAVIHVLMLIGFRNRVIVGIQWAWAYVTRNRAARLITETAESS